MKARGPWVCGGRMTREVAGTDKAGNAGAAWTRKLDDGRPIVLGNPPAGTGIDAFVVYTSVCDNPKCPCTRMYLHVRPARRRSEEHLDVDGAALCGSVSSSGDEVELESDGSGLFTHQATRWVRDQLAQGDWPARLRERWSRLRGAIGDPAHAGGVPPEAIDGLVAFWEVFPWGFDFTVPENGSLYLAEDLYCLEPACRCDVVHVQFLDVSHAAPSPCEPVGRIEVSLRRLRVTGVHGDPIVRTLWDRFLAEYEAGELRGRFERMRQVARKREPSAVTRGLKIGRNAPCPCGSGKKYKRCCGG